MGDGRAEGSSAIGEREQAAISLMPDVGGMHVYIFQSSELEGSYVEDFLYDEWWQDMGPHLVGCYTSHQQHDPCAHFCWKSINYPSQSRFILKQLWCSHTILHSPYISQINSFNLQVRLSPPTFILPQVLRSLDNKQVARTFPFTALMNSLPFLFVFSTSHSSAIPSGIFGNPDYT